jgi:hypothetical protein
MLDKNLIVGLIVVAVAAVLVYKYFPTVRSRMSGLEGFADAKTVAKKNGMNGMVKGTNQSLGGMNNAAQAKDRLPAPAGPNAHAATVAKVEGFSDYAPVNSEMGPVPMKGAAKPQGCYPRETLNPMELLPQDVNSQWAAVNPTGTGDIQGKNFLSAGALIGVNTVGQSLRNSNLQLRAEPPNPQVQVSPWLQSTIEPDLSRRPLE